MRSTSIEKSGVEALNSNAWDLMIVCIWPREVRKLCDSSGHGLSTAKDNKENHSHMRVEGEYSETS